ncbi:mannosyltransferase 1 [Amylocystis lapponica]|nr:mannosyltransferase 1 [Amylocystis lapponica]
MSGSVRARRPASPPPGLPHAVPPSQRFPHQRHDHLDADERREAASRGYVPGRKSHSSGGLNIAPGEWKLLALIVLVACAVRFFRLSQPNSIVFDEVHFGKFASKYIKSQYFVDVHPPLAKLLITLAGFVSGYDGNFDFKDIAKVYEHVPYVAMRMVPAILGVATVPISYLTLRGLDCRATTALLASLFITFENGMITQSRHILLDSPLIFFTALTVFLWTGFCNEDKHEPFTETWWAWLVLSGLSLGAVVSCKWVGLFTIATIGFSTIRQLWLLLGDLRVSPRLFIKHFLARALCLIAIPVVFYMFMFWIHFLILQNPGDGDGFMSSEFQHTLNGRGMADTFADVAIGSEVSIRHVNTQGGYLHSHPHNYPAGSNQQQITLYPHRDDNNVWRILNATHDEVITDIDWNAHPLQYITPGMRVKLTHIQTNKALHSHDVRPPISDVDFQNEVSGYGMPNFAGDINDDWIVEIEKGDRRDRESSKRVRTLRTQFRLRHAVTSCYLFSHKVKLPDWAWEQQEVTCNKQAEKLNSLWYVETAVHPKLPPDAPKVNYKLPSFVSKFLELQQVMWTTNAGLTDRHTFDSRPDAWPRLRRGINFWVKDHRQIYLIGNPMVWWLSTAAVFAYVAVRGILFLRAKRGFRDFENTKVVKYDTLCGFLFVGWGLHYFPFYIMQRQLFLHHYFPALYFAILLSCGVFDLVTSTLRPRVRLQIAAILLFIVVLNYVYLSPLVYGNPWTKAKCQKAKWLKTWDFSCNDFYDNYSQYDHIAQAAVPVTTQPAAATIGGEPGGRGAVVVEDNVPPPKHAAAESADTSVAFGQAEPGYDAFSGVPHEELKSSHSAVAPPAFIEEKEISSVLAQQPTAAPDTSSEGMLAPEVAAPLAAEAGLADRVAEILGDLKEQEQVGAAELEHTQGAPLEDEAEADRARNELFPGAEVER